QGNYDITGINPGQYNVLEVGQAGWTCDFPGKIGRASCRERFVSSGVTTGKDFGNYTTAELKGQKFEDLNANGAKNDGEGGLQGWTIFVDYTDDGPLTVG